jgi:hypothetical protein
MPANGHIDALLGTAWAWDDEDDDEHEAHAGPAAREHERDPGHLAR